jgi:hypothetical protein
VGPLVASGADDPAFGRLRIPVLTVRALDIIIIIIIIMLSPKRLQALQVPLLFLHIWLFTWMMEDVFYLSRPSVVSLFCKARM